MKKKLYSYKNSGVNISLGNKFVKHIAKLTNKNVIALGGISKLNQKKIKLLDCYGISGISYFE